MTAPFAPAAARPHHVSEALGLVSGWMVAPLFALVSFARAARTFHPRGATLHGIVRRHPAAPAHLQALADRLAGHALVRFSAALWKRAEVVPDVLGCAIRFRSHERDDAAAAPDDQDLLLATIRRPWTLSLAPFTTHVKDYLRNDYFGVSPFEIGGARRVYFRLHPETPPARVPGERARRLAIELEQRARLSLECSDKPWGPWLPVVELQLERPAALDDEALRFSPFRTGRGVRPCGFIHALRKRVYDASQAARAKRVQGRAAPVPS